MEKRKAIETAEGTPANPNNAPEQLQPKIKLPVVGSPSISAAGKVSATNAVVEATSVESAQATAAQSETNAQKEKDETAAIPQIAASKRLRFVLLPRRKRHVVLAPSVVIAATLGAVAGIAISGSFSRPAAIDVATVEERKAMQQSVARLTKEITSLKASLEIANKLASSQIAKVSERLNRESPGITGSV